MRIFFLMISVFFISTAFSQTIYRGAVNSGLDAQNNVLAESQYEETAKNTRFKNSEQAIALKNDIKNMRGTIGNSPNTIKARNLLTLKKVLDFKMQDETLKDEINKLQQNREFNTKLLNALNQLDNKKTRNSKNQDVMNILDNAGGRIYNYLAN